MNGINEKYKPYTEESVTRLGKDMYNDMKKDGMDVNDSVAKEALESSLK